VRIHLRARLAEARIPVQLDVGTGDVVSPAPQVAQYPTLLDHAPPRILVYPRETVIAEKLEAIASLGVTNSRMKDFYDLRQLAASSAFLGTVLVEAIRATFGRRGTPLPTPDLTALQPGFFSAPERQTQWRAFLRRSRLSGPQDAGVLEAELRSFLIPLVAAVASSEPFDRNWPPGGPWRSATS